MSKIVARELQGEMQLAGEINERLPQVTRGLVAHYPFDGTTDEYFSSTNVIRNNDFTSSAWIKQADVTVAEVSSTVPSPFLGEKVYKVTKNCTTADTVYYNRVDTLILGGTTGTIKIRVKKGTSNSILFGLGWYTPAYDGYIIYTFSTNSFWLGDKVLSAKATILTDGWIELSIDYTNYAMGVGHLLIRGDTSTTSGLYTYFCKPEIKVNLSPVSSANIAFSKTGLEVTQATTNLMINSENLLLMGNQGATVTQISPSDMIPPFKGAKVWKLLKNVSTQWCGHLYSTISSFSSANACLSMFVKKGNHPRMSLYIWDATLGGNNYLAWATFDFNTGTWDNIEGIYGNRGSRYIGDGWYYIYISTSTFTSGDNLQASFVCNRDAISKYGLAPVGTYCYVSSPQLTQTSYPLFYTPYGTTRGSAFINLPNTILNPLSSGAISIEFDYLCEAYMNSSSKWMMLWQSYTSDNIENNKINICISNGNLKVRTAKADGTTSEFILGTVANLKQGRNKLVYTWDKTNAYHKAALNGNITTAALPANFPTVAPAWVAVGNWTQDWHQFNSTIANVSTYNVYLSDDECKKLTMSPLSLSSTGNATTNIVVEEPVIPSDAYYFPLSSDGRDRGGYVAPVLANNLVFEKGMCWSGNAVTNLLSNGDCINACPSPIVIGNATATVDTSISSSPAMKFLRTSATDLWSYMNLGNATWNTMGVFAVNTPYTFQSKLYIPNTALYTLDKTAHNGCYIGIADRISTSTAERWDFADCDISRTNMWQDLRTTHTINSDATNAYARLMFYCTSLGTAPALFFKNLMISAKPFASAFTNSFRDFSFLTYNFNSSIGLDWSGDWSFAFWVIPYGNSSDRQDAYTDNTQANIGWFGTRIGADTASMASGVASIIQLGSAPISAGKLGYRFDSSSNAVLNSGGSNLVTSSNFYDCKTPRLFSIRKSGTKVYFDIKSTSGETYSAYATNGATLTPNYYVNKLGFDISILGTEGYNGGNGYVYDMVVLKRFMTNTELDTFYRSQLSSNMQKLRVQRNIKEMVVLS